MTADPPFLAFALPDISEEDIQSVVETLRSGWITTGPKAKEFELRFAEATGARHAVMLNSCTAALHLALEAIGIKPGDEVIVPAMTFAATAEVVRYLGATPVLVDVRATDHNIDPHAMERAITRRTRAVIPVYFGGLPADMDEIVAIAHGRGLLVVADAAHCFPASYRGRDVGSLADITCFSFYATKTITSAEGGAAVSDNQEWIDRMRMMSLHGISKDAWNRYAAEGKWYYEIIAPGYKYNMPDLAASLGLSQLTRAAAMRDRRRDIRQKYDLAFASLTALELLPAATDRQSAHHLYIARLRLAETRVSRDELIDQLRRLGIGTSVHFIPLHLHPYYQKTFGYNEDSLPVATGLYQRSVSLPIYSRMTDSDVERVIKGVLGILR